MRQYTLIPSKPYCCVTSVLESILLKYNYRYDQVEIADFFGLTVPEEELEPLAKYFKNMTTSEDVHQLGLHLGKDGLNTFFMAKRIELRETFVSASSLSDMNFDSVLDAIPSEADVIFFFDYGTLYSEQRNKGVGHDGIFLKREGELLSYLDPGPRRLGVNTVNTDDMLNAMKAAYAGGGLSVIKRV